MQCPSCGALNPEEAFFCGECGSKLRSALEQPKGPVAFGGGAVADPLSPPAPSAVPPMGHIVPPQLGSEPPTVLDTPIDPEPLPASASGAITAPAGDLPKPPGFPLEMGIHGATFGAGPGQPPQQPQSPLLPPQPPPSSPPAQQFPPPQQPYLPAQQQQTYLPPAAYGQQQQYGAGGPYLPPAPPPPGFGYNLPPDGNTSGMGEGYPLPPGVSGFNAGGCVPFGLFAFINGNTLWGIISLIGLIISPAQLVYAIYIAIQGRELAWRNRRFDSLEQFQDTMQPWNIGGLVLLGLGVIAFITYIAVAFAFMGPMFEEMMKSGTP